MLFIKLTDITNWCFVNIERQIKTLPQKVDLQSTFQENNKLFLSSLNVEQV